jgi:tellurite resistance protein
MLIIFGTRGRITGTAPHETLKNACPNCNSNLELKDLKRWFTLFFIPIFPFDTIESFYQCTNCDSSYKRSAREALLGNSQNKEEIEQEAKKLFGKTLIACMTHMAFIDGELSPLELEEIEKVKSSFSDFSAELEDVFTKVKTSSNPEEYVYTLLRQSSEELTSQAIMNIIGLSATVLLADGKIDKEEEKLLKEYLLVCGIPKDMYSTIIEKVQQ